LCGARCFKPIFKSRLKILEWIKIEYPESLSAHATKSRYYTVSPIMVCHYN
jgi:hypothetical protein